MRPPGFRRAIRDVEPDMRVVCRRIWGEGWVMGSLNSSLRQGFGRSGNHSGSLDLS